LKIVKLNKRRRRNVLNLLNLNKRFFNKKISFRIKQCIECLQSLSGDNAQFPIKIIQFSLVLRVISDRSKIPSYQLLIKNGGLNLEEIDEH
jgi:hypothetical protein